MSPQTWHSNGRVSTIGTGTMSSGSLHCFISSSRKELDCFKNFSLHSSSRSRGTLAHFSTPGSMATASRMAPLLRPSSVAPALPSMPLLPSLMYVLFRKVCISGDDAFANSICLPLTSTLNTGSSDGRPASSESRISIVCTIFFVPSVKFDFSLRLILYPTG